MRFAQVSRYAVLSLGLAAVLGCEDSSGPQAVKAPAPGTPGSEPPPPAPEKVKAKNGKELLGAKPESLPGV